MSIIMNNDGFVCIQEGDFVPHLEPSLLYGQARGMGLFSSGYPHKTPKRQNL
jgi:hypothetical protein